MPISSATTTRSSDGGQRKPATARSSTPPGQRSSLCSSLSNLIDQSLFLASARFSDVHSMFRCRAVQWILCLVWMSQFVWYSDLTLWLQFSPYFFGFRLHDLLMNFLDVIFLQSTDYMIFFLFRLQTTRIASLHLHSFEFWHELICSDHFAWSSSNIG